MSGRERLTRAGIWSASVTAHVLVFILMGLHVPVVRDLSRNPALPPPIDVVIYEPPPPEPEPREPQPKAAPPQAEPLPPRPRETPPEPEPAPAPIVRPEPPKEAVRETRPAPAPPKPKDDKDKDTAPKPSPIKPREVAKEAPPAPMAPAPVQAAPKPAATPGAGAPGQAAGGGGKPLPDWGVKPGGDLRDAMRRSSVGCANSSAVGLNRREKEKCDERFGEGAKDAAYIPPAIGRAKQAAFDDAAARKTADRKWKEGGVPPGVDPGASPGQITGLDKPK